MKTTKQMRKEVYQMLENYIWENAEKAFSEWRYNFHYGEKEAIKNADEFANALTQFAYALFSDEDYANETFDEEEEEEA